MDADLDVLGRPTFIARTRDLRREMAAAGMAVTRAAWHTNELEFVQTHRDWRPATRRHDAQTHVNIVLLKDIPEKVE